MSEAYSEYRNVEVEGILGRFILHTIPMPIETVREIWNQGEGVPLDLMPSDFWHPRNMPYPRFSEEALGNDF